MVDIITLALSSVFQVKSNLEKAKQALEKETSELSIEIRSLSQAKQDGENKRKKLDSQLADLQSRFTDSEKQKAELGERCSKVTVGDFHAADVETMNVIFAMANSRKTLLYANTDRTGERNDAAERCRRQEHQIEQRRQQPHIPASRLTGKSV